ncbi:PfkB family carbohydrate kinase [Roseinatronobacter sp.]|uniref:PfkB family carbohydrate kinase n=1 Tax=Roseinatronobacter sp. TaxID=1945755 RepID=UPI0025F69B8A|nr:PfkB family carbohydrate kinase [Rhodobaca sp.]
MTPSYSHVINPDPVRPIDSTGAGDAFNGRYLATRLKGATMSDAARDAHDISIRVIGQRGALVMAK